MGWIRPDYNSTQHIFPHLIVTDYSKVTKAWLNDIYLLHRNLQMYNITMKTGQIVL